MGLRHVAAAVHPEDLAGHEATGGGQQEFDWADYVVRQCKALHRSGSAIGIEIDDGVLVFARGRICDEITGERLTKEGISEACYVSAGPAPNMTTTPRVA